MIHVITIATDHTSGADLASCGELSARSLKSCAARKLARLMVGLGMPDEPVLAQGNDGVARYTVRSLHAFARKTLTEAPAQSWWQEHPNGDSAYGRFRAVERERGIGLPKNPKAAQGGSRTGEG